VFRFLHSADLHLGKPFGGFAPELQAQLRRARLEALPRLAAAARDGGASWAVLAGDIFDVAEPPPQLVAQSLEALAAERDIAWLCLPGNHDPHRPGGIWERLARSAPANVRLLLDATPQAVAPGITVLPAPCLSRRSGFDPTDWMDAAPSPEGDLRLGIAHGAVVDFAEDPQADTIDIERPVKAGLDYLALGDWHGAMPLGPRAGYSGTPEPTGFRRNRQGTATLVTLPGPGGTPQAETVETGTFRWIDADIEMLPGTEVLPLIGRLTEGAVRRNTLLSLTLRGAARLPDIAATEEALETLGHGLAHLRYDRTALAIRHETGDLDDIAAAGPLRAVADRLLAEAEAGDAAAREALNLLYGWAVGEGAS
jgi:DNA repair exonuclease SbcCD nuclease subunit